MWSKEPKKLVSIIASEASLLASSVGTRRGLPVVDFAGFRILPGYYSVNRTYVGLRSSIALVPCPELRSAHSHARPQCPALAKGPVPREAIGCGCSVEPVDCVPGFLRAEVPGEKRQEC